MVECAPDGLSAGSWELFYVAFGEVIEELFLFELVIGGGFDFYDSRLEHCGDGDGDVGGKWSEVGLYFIWPRGRVGVLVVPSESFNCRSFIVKDRILIS